MRRVLASNIRPKFLLFNLKIYLELTLAKSSVKIGISAAPGGGKAPTG